MNLAEFLDLIPANEFSSMIISLKQPIEERGLRGLYSTMAKKPFISRVTSTEDFSTMEILNAVGLSSLQKALSSIEPKNMTGVAWIAKTIVYPSSYNNNGFCPLCQLQNDTDAEFCTLCGNTFPPNSDCPICKTVNPIEARYCKKCGESRY